MALSLHPTKPRMRIDGPSSLGGVTLSDQRKVGLPVEFIPSGGMANNFEESYGIEIQAKDQAAEGGGQAGQTPHPPNMNFDRGQFDNTQWEIKLFSGVLINNKEFFKGKDLVAIAELLYKLSMPRPAGSTFIGPPLVTVQYGPFWKARGLFQKVTFVSEGAFDREGYPTLMTLRMEFARHFGGGSQAGGVYRRADEKELRAATAAKFAFKG